MEVPTSTGGSGSLCGVTVSHVCSLLYPPQEDVATALMCLWIIPRFLDLVGCFFTPKQQLMSHISTCSEGTASLSVKDSVTDSVLYQELVQL